jgi:hypothetical protein
MVDTVTPYWLADRERWTLDERLPYVFVAFEERVAAAKERARQAEFEREHARAAELRALERAKVQWVEQYRIQWLEEQVADHRIAVDMRAFVVDARPMAVSQEDHEWLV